jgi:N-sulfoglucosamine sulfohydrolase
MTRLRRLLLLLLASPLVLSARPPDVLLVVADDLGRDLGAYGDTTASTPRLDQLAAEGALFERAYVTQASCSPSRASMLTGLYPHQNGMVGLAPYSKYGYTMRPEIVTLPALLRSVGYRTGLIGKLHIEPYDDRTFPFDLRALTPAAETMDVVRTVEVAESFITADPRPYFLMVNFFDPHRVAGRPTGFKDEVAGLPAQVVAPSEAQPLPFQPWWSPRLAEQVAGYRTAIRRLDHGVGLLLDALARTGRANDTLVIFISDNGPPFTGAKTSNFEAGVHVPLIVRWPARVPAGLRTAALASAIDIVPTVLAASQATAPAYPLPGADWVPLLRHLARLCGHGKHRPHLGAFLPSAHLERRSLQTHLEPSRPRLGQSRDQGRRRRGIGRKLCARFRAGPGLRSVENSSRVSALRPPRGSLRT